MRAIVALLIFASTSAFAQLDKSVTLMQASTALLTQRSVQMHLKVTKQQQELLQSVFKWFAQEAQRIGKASKTREAALAQISKVRLDASQRALNALSSAQKARLRQLGLQAYGPFALMAPDMAPIVKLTAAQKSKLKAIEKTALQKAQAIFRERSDAARAIPRPKDQSNQALMQEYMKQVQKVMLARNASDQRRARAVRDSADKQALAVLTPAQRAQWKALQGKVFPLEGRRS